MKHIINNNVTTYLQQLGLTATQSFLYPYLITLNEPVTILRLSQLSQIPRTTVHQNIMNLIEKGFVLVVKKGNKKLFSAEKPYVLKRTLLEEEVQVRKKLLAIYKLKQLEQSIAEQLINIASI